MAYNEGLVERVRLALLAETEIEEKRMFGGVCFLVRGHMVCGVEKSRLMLRVSPEQTDELMARRGAAPMDFTGRVMRGFLYVDSEMIADDDALREWLSHPLRYVATLPPKGEKAPKKRARKH